MQYQAFAQSTMYRTLCLILFTGVLTPLPTFSADAQPTADRNRQVQQVILQNYPPRALAAGEEGPVFFKITFDKEAHPTSCEVTHGSGHPLLDRETCALMMEHAAVEPAKDDQGHAHGQITEGVVNWTLPGHKPAPINFSAAAVTNLPEKQICKKSLKPGYLSVYERTCMSQSEWQAQRNAARDPFVDMQGKKETPSTAACINPNGC